MRLSSIGVHVLSIWYIILRRWLQYSLDTAWSTTRAARFVGSSTDSMGGQTSGKRKALPVAAAKTLKAQGTAGKQRTPQSSFDTAAGQVTYEPENGRPRLPSGRPTYFWLFLFISPIIAVSPLLLYTFCFEKYIIIR